MAVDIYWELKIITHGAQMLKVAAGEVVSRSGSSIFVVMWQDPSFPGKKNASCQAPRT